MIDWESVRKKAQTKDYEFHEKAKKPEKPVVRPTSQIEAARNADKETISTGNTMSTAAKSAMNSVIQKRKRELLTQKSKANGEANRAFRYRESGKSATPSAAKKQTDFALKELDKKESWLNGPEKISPSEQLGKEIETARVAQGNANYAASIHINKVGERAAARKIDVPAEEKRRAASKAFTDISRKKEKLDYIKEYDGRKHEDKFTGQFAANYDVGRLSQDSAMAWSEYLTSPTKENRDYAEAIDELSVQFQTNNAKTLDDKATIPLLSKTAANYLPQFFDQTAQQIKGGVAGAAIGTLVAPGAGTVTGAKAGAIAASGAYAYKQMQGAAFKSMLDAGIKEDVARKMAQDEAIISGIIEMGDTALDIATLGIGALSKKALAMLGKETTEKVAATGAKKVLKALAGYGINVAGEAGQEWTQEAVSIANIDRAKAGEKSGAMDLTGKTLKLETDVLLNKNQAAAAQMGEAALEGGKIAAMFGGGTMLSTAGTSAGLTHLADAKTGKEVKKAQQNFGLVERGLSFAPDSETYKQASKLAAVLGGGETQAEDNIAVAVTNAQYGKLARTMAEELNEKGPKSEQEHTETVQALHPDEKIMSRETQAFYEFGDTAEVAEVKGTIMNRLFSGDTSITDEELQQIDPHADSTMKVFSAMTGMEFPDTNEDGPILATYRSLATYVRNVIDENTRAEEEVARVSAEAAAQVQNEEQEVQAPNEELPVKVPNEEQPIQGPTVTLTDGTNETQDEFVQSYLSSHPRETAENANAVFSEAVRANKMGIGYPVEAQNAGPVATGGTSTDVKQARHSVVAQEETANSPAQSERGEDTTTALTKEQKWTARYATAMLRGTGIEGVEIAADGLSENENGYYADGKIVLNGKNLTSQRAIMTTLGHELVHPGSDVSATLVDDILNVATELIGESAVNERFFNTKVLYTTFLQERNGWTEEEATAKVTDRYVQEEVAADLMSEVFASTDAMSLMAGKKPGILERAKRSATLMLEKLQRGKKRDNNVEAELNGLILRLDKALRGENGETKPETKETNTKRAGEAQSTAESKQETIEETDQTTAEEDLVGQQMELSDKDVRFSIRKKTPPKETGIAYKVFYAKDGQLYPPMVANPNGAGTPVGVWLDADVGQSAPPSKTGRAQVQGGGKGTNAGKMSLAFRPGWHLGDIPLAKQFARLNQETGEKDLFPSDFVWAECEYAKDVDYQEEAMSYGYTENGKFRHAYAGLPKVPTDGYYRYRTNPNPDTVPWVISGAMKVNKILTDKETDAICRKNGAEPMARQGGTLNLEKLGLGTTTSTKDGKTAAWSDKRIDRLYDAYASSSQNYAKAYAAFISPDDFLSLTTSNRGQIEAQSRPLDTKELEDERQEIQLTYDPETPGEVFGHEGRHRMVALKNAGVERVAIAIQFLGEAGKYDRKPIKSLPLRGEDFGRTRAPGNVTLTDLVPISQAYRAEIEEKFGKGTKADVRFSLKAPVEETKDLLALHNLTEKNLLDALEIGGMPMPSIAVVQAKQGHERYGEISLVFSKDTIDPKLNSKNKVYGGDAYTPTAPAIDRTVNRDIVRRVSNKIYDLSLKIADGMFTGEASSALYFDDDYTSDTMYDILDKLSRNNGVKAAYLTDHGKTLSPVMSENVKKYDSFGNDALSALGKHVGVQELSAMYERATNENGLTTEDKTAVRAEIRTALENREGVVGSTPEQISRMIEAKIQKLTEERMAGFIRNAWKLHEDGTPAVAQEVDRYATIDALDDAAPEDAVREWVRPQIDGLLGEAGVYNGKERYTQLGNRKSFAALHNAYTLENIVKAMDAQQKSRGEATWGVTAKTLQSVTTPSYKSVKDIKADSGRLGTAADSAYEAQTNAIDAKISDIIHQVKSGNKAHSDNPFTESDIIAEAMMEAARGTKTVDSIIRSFSKDDYKISAQTAQDIQSVFKAAQELPTEYFEAKPRRAVGFDEVLAAVVPSDASAELRGALDRADVRTLEYKSGDDADRLKKVNSVDGARFSLKADSDGTPLTKEQDDYFKDSKVRDNSGALLHLYHGGTVEHEFDTNISAMSHYGAGSYFTDARFYAKEWANARNGSVTEYYLDMKHPFDERHEIPKTTERENLEKILRDNGATDAGVRGALNNGFLRIGVTLERLKNPESKYSDFGTSTGLANAALREAGYDGIIAEFYDMSQYIIFSPEQAKLTSNLTPTKSNDTRYSVSGKATEAEVARLRKMNEYLKSQMKLSTVAKMEPDAAGRMAASLLKEYSSGYDKAELETRLQAAFGTARKGKNGNFEAAQAELHQIAADILDAAVQHETSLYDEYAGLRKHLHGMTLTLSDTDKADLDHLGGYDAIRKHNFGRFNMGKNGTPVDVAYDELSARWGELFPKNVTHPADQLAKISDALDSIKPTEGNPYSGEMEIAADYLASDIMQRFLDTPQRTTFADKQAMITAKKLAAVRAGGKASMDALRRENAKLVQEAVLKERSRIAGRKKLEAAIRPANQGAKNVNPQTGYEVGSVADSFMRMVNAGDKEKALDMLETILVQLTPAEDAEAQRKKSAASAFLPRLTEDAISKNRKEIQALIDKYGAMEQTSAAERKVLFPKKTDENTKVRGFVQTAAASKNTPDSMIPELEQMILNGSAGATYVPIGDTATINKVREQMAGKSLDAMIAEWRAKIDSNVAITKFDITHAEQLYVEVCDAVGSGNDPDGRYLIEAQKLISEIAMVGTQSGQVTQAMSMLKKMTPSGQLYYLNKTAERMGRDNHRLRKLGGDISIDPVLAKNLLEAKTKDEIDTAVDAIIQNIADQVPVTLADKWNAWRYLSMLGNTRTHIRNFFGNAIFMPARLTKDLLSIGIESIAIKDDGQRTKGFSTKETRAFAKADALEMEGILRGGGKQNPTNLVFDARRIFKWTLLESVRKGNMAALELEDWLFLKNAYSHAMAGFLAARKVNLAEIKGSAQTESGARLLNEARAYAVQEAQKATYRDMNQVATQLNQLKRKSGPIVNMLMEGLIPFTKTPINIIKRGIEYSPIGLIKALKIAVQKGSAAEIIDSLCAGLTGTGIATIGWLLSKLGLLVGGFGDDPEDEFARVRGEQEYSIRIGNHSYTIDWTAPVALPLFVGAEIEKVLRGEFDAADIPEAIATIFEPMLSLSMLDGLNRTLSSVRYDSSDMALINILKTVAGNYFSQGVPTIMGQIARTVDQSRRTSFTPKGQNSFESWASRTFQTQVLGKVPVASQKRMLYIDAWGRTDDGSGVVMRAFENFISPGYYNEIQTSNVDKEIMRLATITHDTGVYPKRASKYFSVGGEDYAMSQEEYQNHLIDRGTTSLKMAGNLINSPVYAGLNDSEKAKAVEILYDYAGAMAKEHTNKAFSAAKWITKLNAAIAQGSDASDYIAVKAKSDIRSKSVVETIAEDDNISDYSAASIIASEFNANGSISDPYMSKYEFVLTPDQRTQYEKMYREAFIPAYLDASSEESYHSASAAEREAIIADVQKETRKWTKYDFADWMEDQNIQSTAKKK